MKKYVIEQVEIFDDGSRSLPRYRGPERGSFFEDKIRVFESLEDAEFYLDCETSDPKYDRDLSRYEFRIVEAVAERSIKIHRGIVGLSQSGLAKASGVSIKAIQKYESGERSLEKAEAGNVKRLAQALGLAMEDLV